MNFDIFFHKKSNYINEPLNNMIKFLQELNYIIKE